MSYSYTGHTACEIITEKDGMEAESSSRAVESAKLT